MPGNTSAVRDLYSDVYNCATGVAVNNCVYISAPDTVGVADGFDPTKMPCVGIVVSKPTPTSCILQYAGELNVFNGLTPGPQYYVGAAGGITTDPTGLAVQQVIGYARDSVTLVVTGAGVIGGDGGGTGTVTSVALSAPGEFIVAGSPIHVSGTLALSKAAQSANLVYAGPTSGGAAAPGFRAVVAADLPIFVASGSGHAAGAVPDPGSSAGTTRYLREDSTWQVPPGGGGGGTVTSVGLTAPAEFSITGSPVTGSGNLGFTKVNQAINSVWAGPASGSPGAPVFRLLVAADLPVFVGSGASHAPGAVPDPGASAGTTRFLREDSSWQVPPFGTGSVTSVGLAAPVEFSVSGSPVTVSGNLTFTKTNQTANTFWAGPASGSPAVSGFRAIVAADMPVFVASGGSHASGAVPDPGSSAGTTRFLREDASWQVPAGGGFTRYAAPAGTAGILAGQPVTVANQTGTKAVIPCDPNIQTGGRANYSLGLAANGGSVGTSINIAQSGDPTPVAVPDARWDGGVPTTADEGRPVYISTAGTPGQLTVNPNPSTGYVQVMVDILETGGSGACTVLVQVQIGVMAVA